jgi:hypothetical protein
MLRHAHAHDDVVCVTPTAEIARAQAVSDLVEQFLFLFSS